MLKKAVLIVLVAMLFVFGASISYAQPVIDGLEAGIVSQAFVNPGGLGDSLVYGYYNVRGNLNLFEIVNTSQTDGAKVRVVFRNAKNSKECLDFTVCLSLGDKWTAYLIDNGTTAAICPFDTDTITAPTIPPTCQAFKYEGSGGISGVTADDCREGYFEAVGMMGITGYDSKVTDPVIADEGDCRDYQTGPDLDNVLMGENMILDWSQFATYEYNATAIGDTRFTPVLSTTSIDVGGFPAVATNSCDPLINLYNNEPDYILMKEHVMAPYDLISWMGGETELILTFPTRHVCHPDPDNTFDADTTDPEKFCVKIRPSVWDDKEHRLDITDFSPGLETCLPHEVNIIRLGASNIWSSTVASIIDVGTFDLGWVDIDLSNLGAHTNTYNGTAYGLPAIAYTTQSFVGGYASYMAPMAYKTNIE
jgi:hypothetical protein